MEKQLDDQLTEEIRALVEEENRKLLMTLQILRQENIKFVSALSEGVSQALKRYTNESGEGVSLEGETVNEPAPIQLVNTKGIHKKTIKAAELVGQILQERNDMRLSEIAEEVERRGGDFGANPTITMKSIMKIAPAIKKVRRGRFAYDPQQEKETE
ncbi:Rok-like winged helix domain-containing protein [Salinithrix halophila]|uniref:Repressor Rok winged helix domain-containing protein n=1 Tax=Salinithrix halophila TaxID=1485204 RepID=A0ABV8JM21_9BACL